MVGWTSEHTNGIWFKNTGMNVQNHPRHQRFIKEQMSLEQGQQNDGWWSFWLLTYLRVRWPTKKYGSAH